MVVTAVCTRTNLFEIRFVVFQLKHVDGWACSCSRSAHAFRLKTSGSCLRLQTVSDMGEWLGARSNAADRGKPTCSETDLV